MYDPKTKMIDKKNFTSKEVNQLNLKPGREQHPYSKMVLESMPLHEQYVRFGEFQADNRIRRQHRGKMGRGNCNMEFLSDNQKFDIKVKKRPASSGYLTTARSDKKKTTVKKWFKNDPKTIEKNPYVDPKVKSTIDMKKETGREKGSWNNNVSHTSYWYDKNFSQTAENLEGGSIKMQSSLGRNHMPLGRPLETPNLVKIQSLTEGFINEDKVTKAINNLGHHKDQS